MMKRLSLSHRLTAVFALLLLSCCASAVWLQRLTRAHDEQRMVQSLSLGLAAHIAQHTGLLEAEGLTPRTLETLFSKLMDVNPSVEVYLLTPQGRILAQAAPPGHLKRTQVDMAPVHHLLAGDELPILGDDPRSVSGTQVFSAAPLERDGQLTGYLYVVLLGEAQQALAQQGEAHTLQTMTWRAVLLVASCGLVAGLLAFHWVTRPLRAFTAEVQRYQAGQIQRPPPGDGDEITALRLAFDQMTARIDQQWLALQAQDRQRRELVANLSHDLRTPLTSLHGYLETLRLKSGTLSEEEARRYLDIALGQSERVGRLAQELFELARLEHGDVRPQREPFSLPELVQDILQKFELAAQARGQRLHALLAPDVPLVLADLGLIERALTNLLDNAIRHTPEGGLIEVQIWRSDEGVAVRVSDNGPGLPEPVRLSLSGQPHPSPSRRGAAGGLGLLIVRRILQLHNSDIQLERLPERGAVFRFALTEAR